MKGREIGSEELEELKNGLDRYIKVEGIDSKLVNIPTVVTGLNKDGTIREEVIDPYAYEVMDQNKTVID
jgi:hypothetical protein